MVKRYVLNVLLGVDRLFNAVFGGDSKETISTRVYRYRDVHWCARLVYRFLNWLEKDHCEMAIAYDYSEDHNDDEVLK